MYYWNVLNESIESVNVLLKQLLHLDIYGEIDFLTEIGGWFTVNHSFN